MATIPEQLSNILANSQGKTDANLAQDSNNLGGLPAEDFATKEYVKKYHDTKEATQKEYIDNQDTEILKQAKEFANSLIRNQDFSSFAKLTDVQTLDTKLSGELTSGLSKQKAYTDKEIEKVVNDTNENFENVNGVITMLNGNMSNLFQSVSDGKSKIAGAITDKGVSTSATDTFDNMASNIRSIPTTGGEIPEGYVDTSSATASDSDLLQGKTAFARGNKIIGSHVCTGIDTSDATATPYDILTGKTAYNGTGKIEGVLNIDESTGIPSYSIGAVQKVYGTRANSISYYSTNAEKQQGLQLTENTVIREKCRNDGTYLASYLFDIEDTNIVIAKRDNINKRYSDVAKYPLSDFGFKIPISDEETTEICGIGVSNLNITYPYMIIATQYNVKGQLLYIRIYTIPLEVAGSVDGVAGDITVKKEQMTVSEDISIGVEGDNYSGYTIKNMNTTLEGDRFILYCNEDIDFHGISTVALVFDISTTYRVTYIGRCYAGTGRFCNSISESFLIDKNTFVVGGYFNDNYKITVKSLGVINTSNQVINNELKGNVMAISTDGKKILYNDYDIEDVTEDDGTSYRLYKYKYYIQELSIDYVTGKVIKENIRLLPTGILPDTIKTYANNDTFAPKGYFISNNLFILYINSDSRDDIYKGLLYYNVNFDTTNVFSIFYRNQNKYLTKKVKREPIINGEQRIYSIGVNSGQASITAVDTYYADKDFSQVIALIYEGKYYYNNIYQNLAATPSDVREGQTFIGFNGKPEIGTMVVENTETTETGGATNE